MFQWSIYYIFIYLYIYISLQIMNIWHYIHPHYRYDIQEMKIVLAKQLPFFHLSSNYRVSHSKFKEVLYRSISMTLTLFPPHGLRKHPLETVHIMEKKQTYQRWGHRCRDTRWYDRGTWLETGWEGMVGMARSHKTDDRCVPGYRNDFTVCLISQKDGTCSYLLPSWE